MLLAHLQCVLIESEEGHSEGVNHRTNSFKRKKRNPYIYPSFIKQRLNSDYFLILKSAEEEHDTSVNTPEPGFSFYNNKPEMGDLC